MLLRGRERRRGLGGAVGCIFCVGCMCYFLSEKDGLRFRLDGEFVGLILLEKRN